MEVACERRQVIGYSEYMSFEIAAHLIERESERRRPDGGRAPTRHTTAATRPFCRGGDARRPSSGFSRGVSAQSACARTLDQRLRLQSQAGSLAERECERL